MAARGTSRPEPVREAAPAEPGRTLGPEHPVISLQRAVGNAAVARLLGRTPAALALPPGATHLGEFRQWATRLRELVKLPKPPVSVSDIRDANLWLVSIWADGRWWL